MANTTWTANVGTLCLTILILIVLQLVFTLWKLFRQRQSHRIALAAFPCPPARHWFYGHHWNTSAEQGIQDQLSLGKLYSHYYQRWVGPFRGTLSLIHPDSVKAILSTAEPKSPNSYGVLKEWLGDGLLISSGAKWKRNRRLLTPAFHFDILKPYVKVYNDCVEVLMDKWCKGDLDKPVELFKDVSLLTLDSLLKCIFSVESNCQTDSGHNEYVRSVKQLALLFIFRYRTFLPSFLFRRLVSHGRQWAETLDILHGYTKQVIDQKRNNRKKEQATEKTYVDFLDILLDAKDEDGDGLTDKEIQDEVDTFMFRGHDTTASGISWCLYNLARYPEYQQKCREEIDELVEGKDNKEIEWEDLHCLNYTTMFIKESLRFHPPVSNISRRTTTPLHFPDGKVLPAGFSVAIFILGVHHNPHVWDDPEVFDPMRFSSENSKNRTPYAFIPFAAGPRNCIGQNFAMNELKVVISRILHRFELSIDNSCPTPKRRFGFVLRAENGIYIKLKPRSSF
ncbi:leukotriene-B4 omega-hydroxylase 3-like [Saccoglossus kowalevskii]|uniref:Leukotriene-B4 omega-hydroxylase 3-like n=1 Tax=Saccoglossus kowalevskii TaxID=10224 RepID=A0ABM0H0J9_SACKO|nr:PREDICTED: leukotriene-B4 omega-hydroxylase 3-like [Saccoglossus kowalevskii]